MLSTLPLDAIYRQSLHYLPDAFVLVEVIDNEKQSGRIIDLNDKACSLLEYEKQELLSAHSDAHPVARFFSMSGKKDEEEVGERRVFLKTKFDRLVYAEIVSNQFTVDGTVFNFHSFKEIEEFGGTSSKESIWIKMILDTIQAYMVILTPEGRVVKWNYYCEKESGYTFKEIKGRFFWDVLIEKQEVAHFQEAFSEDSIADIPVTYENFWIKKNGKKKFIKWSNSLIKDNAGKILYVLSTGIDITERKEIEETLVTSENRFRTLVNSIDDQVFTVNEEYEFSGVFGKWFQTNNIPKERILNKKLHQLNLSEKEIEIHKRAFEQAFNGENVMYDWTLETDKHSFYYQTSLSPMLIPEHEVKELVGVTRDITELKNNETLLNELNRQNETILSSTADGILVVNQQDMIAFANEKAVEMLSKAGEAPIGRPFREVFKKLIHEENLKGKTIFEDNEIFETECKLENGKKVYYQFLGNEMKEGNFRRGYVISIRDVTYKRVAEERKKRFYEAVSSGIVVLNQEGKIQFSNRKATEILGLSSDELASMGSYSKEWKALGEDGKLLLASEHPIMRTFSIGENVHNCILAVYNPQKKQHRWLLVDATAIYENEDPGQPIEYVISTFTDITEQIELNKRVNGAEKLAVIGRLAAAVAHEIRNPLTSINGFLKLLSPALTGKERTYLEILYDEIDRINRVTSEFLVLAKTQEEKREAINVRKGILEPVMESYATSEKANQITFEFNESNKQSVNVLGVKKQLKQLFKNLFDNSIEAMPNGGKIRVNLIEGIELIKVFISDEGSGIPPERLKYIGEPFYSLKEKGTGLGITICNKIIRDHGGELSISSDEHKGTTVEITLPKIK